MAAADSVRNELNAKLAGKEVAAALGNPVGVILHVCMPERPYDQRHVFFWEVEVKPEKDDNQGTWSMSFDALDTLGLISREDTMKIFHRHMSSAAWE